MKNKPGQKKKKRYNIKTIILVIGNKSCGLMMKLNTIMRIRV